MVGTKVDAEYRQLLDEGMDQKRAAKIAQQRTGLALRSGRPVKRGYGKFKS